MGFLDDLKQLRKRVDALTAVVADLDDVQQTHHETLKEHDKRIGLLEGVLTEVATKLDELGSYKQRSTADLREVRVELDRLHLVVETMIKHLVNTAGLQEAKALQKRLRQNRTLVQNILESRDSA